MNLEYTEVKDFPVVMDYGMSPEAMVEECHFDFVEEGIVNRFPIIGKGKIELTISIIFGGGYFSDEVLETTAALQCRPARFGELLAFARHYPDFQRKWCVAALGSENLVEGSRRIPVLLGHSTGRLLRYDRWVRNWRYGHTFASVRL